MAIWIWLFRCCQASGRAPRRRHICTTSKQKRTQQHDDEEAEKKAAQNVKHHERREIIIKSVSSTHAVIESHWMTFEVSLSLFPSFARFFNWKLSDASGSSVNEEMMGVWRKYLMHLEHCIYIRWYVRIWGGEGDGWMRLSSWNDLQLIANLTQARLGSPPTDMRELDVTRRRTKNECGKLIFSGKKEREMSSMPNDIYLSYMESVRSCSFSSPHLYTSPLAIFSSHILCDMSTWFVEVIRWKMRYKLRRRTRSRATMCERRRNGRTRRWRRQISS